MTPNNLPLSLIIPTHNRRAALAHTLAALTRQTLPPACFEVIIVVDGCTDDTAALLQSYAAPFSLRQTAQPGQGPAAARNAGAALAQGQRLLFLDDDIEADPDLLAAHLQAHEHNPAAVVIGYLPPVLAHQTGFFKTVLKYWWELMFDRLREPGHRFAYNDLLTGNFSLPAGLFAQLGGFNEALHCHEDYEFGLRLHRAGAPFVFCPQAKGDHHEITTLNRALHRKRQEGQADVQLGRLHPQLRPELPLTTLFHFSRPASRLMRVLAFFAPVLGDALAWLIQAGLRALEWGRLHGLWRWALDGLMVYWYWRGVSQELPTLKAVREFVAAVPAEPFNPLPVDLARGLAAAEALLDAHGPAAIEISFGSQPVGVVRPKPGAERLRGRHLRRLLALNLAPGLLKAMAAAGQFDFGNVPPPVLTGCDQKLEQNARHEAILYAPN